ncbi:survival motor neuron-like protein [Stemphylium lycopersici]|nr:survival motor neuron-like protein [Stemphylium lycopersici]
MAPVVDMSDKHAWDDSLLINSWDEAVNEYKKYHSIHQSGRRLEDVLTEDELKELRDDYGDLMQKAETTSTATGANGVAEQDDSAMSNVETSGAAQPDQTKQEPERSEPQEHVLAQSPTAGAAPAPSAAESLADGMPQAILGTVKDENMKNMMMSWYYAGYYTGLHAGQQQAPQDAQPKQ